MRLNIEFLTLLIGMFLAMGCEQKKSAIFKLIDPSKTGIDFENTIVETDSINVFEYMNIYTGAGVAVGDIDNDGLLDVYFSGNMVSGRLYRNKGNFQFEDITEISGLLNDRWGTGATMIDVNQDGHLDIYICVSGNAKAPKNTNMLYINNGDNTFTERAEEYGLDDARQSMQAAFFDYDKDNDLDMYLLVNQAAYKYNVNVSQPRKLDGTSVSNDRLYRNDGNGKFTDVTLDAGILIEGYGLGVAVSDINGDEWPDIYISNDFIGNDILYINQKDGTFKDEIKEQIKHTSYAGMGNDVADIDNNGKPDILVLDMRPEDNKRQKLIISSTGYDRFQMMLDAGYNPQYSRNTLQINQGGGKFSEVGFLAGISSTDWSWSPLIADFDNDGFKDLYVTNGFLRDLGNLDYIHYQSLTESPVGNMETKIKQKLSSIQELPKAALINYAYQNKGDITFQNVSEAWGFKEPSCSNGSAYADLDNDGDLDLLVNNINQPAFVYQNLSEKRKNNHYFRIKLNGKPNNSEGIGTQIQITAAGNTQYYQHYLSRGYESSIDPIIHFGLGKTQKIDLLQVKWPDGGYEELRDISANQLIELDQLKSEIKDSPGKDNGKIKMFLELTDSLGTSFAHREDNMVDFKLQPILPHMHSRNGPGIAISDVNIDGREDFFIGGASGQPGELFLQMPDGSFESQKWVSDPQYEDMGSLFFDANNDGYPDLYVVSGGVFTDPDSENFQDRLYLNNGLGTFAKSNALPKITSSGSCVTGNDFDKDGDLDLFVGGRVTPGAYPMPAKSHLLENITGKKSAEPRFVDIGRDIEGWNSLTMVTAALWTDYDNDGWTDLIAVGEFIPITFFHNEQGRLVHQNQIPGLSKTEGWWNSIHGGDFDQDGDIDYILGNLGLNTKYKASQEEPLCIYASDFDKNGQIDPVMCYFIEGENHLAHSRDEIIGQINAMRSRFTTYESYAQTPFNKAFLPEELDSAYIVKSYNFENSYLENKGNGRFELKSLPIDLQTAPIKGITISDMDFDGKQDILLTGNSYATEAATGRYDAFLGAFLKGNGDGTFRNIPWEESGFLSDLDGSGLALLQNIKGTYNVLAANNDAPLKLFASQNIDHKTWIKAEKDVQFAEIELINDTKYKIEFYFGSGYLSQSSRSIPVSKNIKNINFTDVYGITKTVFEAN
ncbi:VCBS repeat-containing protein [Arenibacter sp. F26102]|uniref:VCBS repeat-containing protein n=1 Tax=Arenibacter sp. F26102 TaxID=2926416 RepID=UPI001FF4BEC0|nr:VCBS repeat-containing protein [Arenibacter sp. F26102]MCK0144553.1 VCBS repeat-containing protein [Arenibacter sp. F26102]